MDDAMQNRERNTDRILLRYSTQYTVNGRIRTIEMNVPVPLGATQEERELLFSEAEAGMKQLSSRVEQIANQAMKQVPAASTSAMQNGRAAAPSSPATRPASVSAPQTTEQPTQPIARAREPFPEPAPAVQRSEPLARQPVGASMPLGAGGDVPNNLTIPQFMKMLNENLGLDSKQAMQKLGVRSLSGLNLRKALEQLQQMTQTENGSSPLPTSHLAPADSGLEIENTPPIESRSNSGGNGSRAVGFDEEEGLEGEEEPDELDELDFSEELTNQQRIRAREIIKRLREYGGMTVGSQSRLLALKNVLNGQISDQQLIEVIQGIWNIKAANRLKVEQVEAVISWAKEDDFVSEVENIIKLFEEEG
jgi:hypothetical protein